MGDFTPDLNGGVQTNCGLFCQFGKLVTTKKAGSWSSSRQTLVQFDCGVKRKMDQAQEFVILSIDFGAKPLFILSGNHELSV